MSAELLRRAAKEMRERAEAAPTSPWHWEAVGKSGYPQRVSNPGAVVIAECFENPDFPASCAEHITSWHPAVALAVADLLDEEAQGEENGLFDASFLAVAVASAYLGEMA